MAANEVCPPLPAEILGVVRILEIPAGDEDEDTS
jgi:hypothetical protein